MLIHPHRTATSLLIVMFAAGFAAARTAPPGWYSKQAGWRETMVASLTAIQADEEAASKDAGIRWDRWYETKAMGADSLQKEHFPEKRGVDLKEKSGKKSVWSRRDYPDGMRQSLKLGRGQVIYLCRQIDASEAATVPVYFETGNEMLVRLNGKTVAVQPLKSDRSLGKADLALVKGSNLLLVKMYCAQKAAPFYFSTAPTRGLVHGADRFKELCSRVAADFTDQRSVREMEWEFGDRIWAWNRKPDSATLAKMYARFVPKAHLEDAKELAKRPTDKDAAKIRAWYIEAKKAAEVLARAKSINLQALRLSIEHMIDKFGDSYPHGPAYLKELAELEKGLADSLKAAQEGDSAAVARLDKLAQLEREALLANPLITFDKLLVVKRSGKASCLPANYHGNCALSRGGFNDSIETLDLKTGEMTTVYKPDLDVFVGDVDLNFDGKTMLFSSMDQNRRWQIYEIGVDGRGFRQVTPGTETDVDNYDPCYLPDGRIIFSSTRCFAGVPCVGGKAQVANFCSMNADGSHIRQLCFDQEHDLFPVVLPNGKIMYMRWEYTDAPHYFTRLIMTMNPDGTQQMAYYGSNSYWPNSLLTPRPVPGHPSKFMGIVSGHHGTRRSGELYVFDPAEGQHEADGVVQQIPGHGKKVEAVIKDRLVDGVWPQFLQPYPLSENYVLVSAKRDSRSPWAIYLADTFDNLLKVRDVPGADLYEPVPLRPTPRPPVVPDKVIPSREDGIAYLVDIYRGPGLRGVPRGSVKKLRVFQWHYAYNLMGGHNAVAVEGGWEPKRILGTVPVEKDGSALFRVPADTPVSVQPLDADGRAMQIMRSWFTLQRGEVLSCVGCHEPHSETPIMESTVASRRPPREIEPWLGPARGLSFVRDVQPVLERNCVSCHDGSNNTIPNFKDTEKERGFTKSYQALHPYVRRPGPESDYHLFRPMEYHASTSELITMLKKGHKGVQLSQEDWSRLYTWIDLNVPDYGTWTEQRGQSPFMERRAEMMKLYACVNVNPEEVPTALAPVKPVAPGAVPKPPPAATLDGWPEAPEQAARRQQLLGDTSHTIDLGGGVTLSLVHIPAGRFLMGDVNGASDEWPQSEVTIEKPFWIGACEISNRQYARFDADHDSRYIDQQWKDHTTPGYPANKPDQPVIRVTWTRAMEFCDWLSRTTGEHFSLPTEAQWEYACRAGTGTPFWYGDTDTDFGKFENLADATLVKMAVKGVNPSPVAKPDRTIDFIPRDARFNDGQMIAAAIGSYATNPWGLHDIHGNVAEWTRSDYRPYPYMDDDGRNDCDPANPKVMRGGSWRDRPEWARSSARRSYEAWQPVFNGGFRVVMED